MVRTSRRPRGLRGIPEQSSTPARRLCRALGEIPRGASGDDHWGHDPEHPALIAAIDESNRLVEVEADACDALLDYPARSAADVAHKLAAVLDVWRATKQVTDEPDYHELLAMKLMQDTERVLYDLLPPERLPIVA